MLSEQSTRWGPRERRPSCARQMCVYWRHGRSDVSPAWVSTMPTTWLAWSRIVHRRRWSRSRERPAGGRWGFWKVPAAVPGPGDEIVYPRRTEYFDYEGEAAVVIGKSFKDLSGDRLEEYVWGITLVNDWSLRDGVDNQPEVPRPISYNLARTSTVHALWGRVSSSASSHPRAWSRDADQWRGAPAFQYARHGCGPSRR